MVLHSCIGVGHGYFSESGVAGEICRVEEHFKVHHIVNDNLYTVGTSFANRRYLTSGPHLKICRIRGIPAPCTTNNRTKSGSEHRGKPINSVDRSLVHGISSSPYGWVYQRPGP